MSKWNYMSIQGQGQGRGHSLTLAQGHSDTKIKTFLRNYWAICNQISYENFWEQGNENLLINLWSHDQ